MILAIVWTSEANRVTTKVEGIFPILGECSRICPNRLTVTGAGGLGQKQVRYLVFANSFGMVQTGEGTMTLAGLNGGAEITDVKPARRWQ